MVLLKTFALMFFETKSHVGYPVLEVAVSEGLGSEATALSMSEGLGSEANTLSVSEGLCSETTTLSWVILKSKHTV